MSPWAWQHSCEEPVHELVPMLLACEARAHDVGHELRPSLQTLDSGVVLRTPSEPSNWHDLKD